MIHLDRSHHELDQTQKPNLILSRDHDANHFDWDVDNPAFFHDDLHDLHNQVLSEHPIQTHDLHLTNDVISSPLPPQQDLHDDNSSSLSPAPESGSPPPDTSTAPQHPKHPHEHSPAQDKQEPDVAAENALTPLTELSPGPDLDDAPEDAKEVQDESKADLTSQSSSNTVKEDNIRDKRRDQPPPVVHINGVASPSPSGNGSPSRQIPAFHGQSPDVRLNGTSAVAGPSHSRASSGDFLVPSLPASVSAPTTHHSSNDSKVVRILEVNAELFKISLEFQVRGIPISDPRFQQYALRLQVNLTWLAAAADQRHNQPNITLPIMEPPPVVDFASMTRIQQLYTDLPTIFAKDIARRQLLSAGQHGSPTAPGGAPNGALKRTRPDEPPDLASKRRDTGENKVQVTQASMIPIAAAPSHPNPPTTFPASNQSNLSIASAPGMPQSPRVSSPAMAPPSATPSLPFGATEASIAASSRARARELQIQQAREQQLRQAAQMQQMQAGRHMSPPSTSPQVPQGVGSMTGGQPNSLAAYGSHAQQLIAVLQSPSHPLMQYILQQIPQFTSLPLPQQMQKLQMVQNMLAQRQQQQQQQLQNPQTATPQRNPQMTGMPPNAGMATMANGPMGAGGGPSPVSPLAQQSPVMSQQPHMSSQPVQNGMFPFNQGHANPGLDPRVAASTFPSQMTGGVPNNVNMNQRQLMLVQQQMRNTGGGMNAVPNMMNPQQQAYAMAQRMAQAGPSQPGGVGGSPMSAPAGDQFPVLRSNSTIPGIARSARSPSDGVHSPMTPRAPSRLSQQSQLQQNDYSQAMMQHAHSAMPQNTGPYSPQVQNPNWPQSGQQPMQQQMGMVGGQMNGYSMNSPSSAGGFFGTTPSPSSQTWAHHQQGMTGSYPYGQSMGQQHAAPDQTRLSHMAGMPIPQNMSPIVDSSGGAPGEYDIFNYNSS